MIPDVQVDPIIDERRADVFQAESEISFLDILVLVSLRRRFVLRFMIFSTLLAILVAFLLPVRYEAKTLLLPPVQNSSIGTSLLGELSGGGTGALGSLATLAGGGFGMKNPSDMYVSFLTSRTVEDALIQRFGLLKEYHKKRMSDARKVLERRTTAKAGAKDGLIQLSIEDSNPDRAVALANAYVDEFRKLSASLAITEAARRRLFFEGQVQDAKEKLTMAENAMSKTQQSTGVLEIDTQGRALIEAAAVLRGQVVAKQVQIEAMRAFATDDNPNLVLAKQELAALQAQLARVAGSNDDSGSDINLSKGRVTKEGLEYLRRYRDLRYQETVFELLAKELEIAKLDEAREGSIVQVVDVAVRPDKRSSPHRLWIILGSAFSSFFLAIFWIVMQQRFARASELPGNSERLEIIRGLWTRKRGNG
jgi:tyrosine-protein kinase Etk/Wzc